MIKINDKKKGGESQSLLNEVWFPTICIVNKKVFLVDESQSLLNEVWFPTYDSVYCYNEKSGRNPF